GLLFQEGAILVFGALLVYQVILAPQRGRGWLRLLPFALLSAGYLLLRSHLAGALPTADLALVERLRAFAYLPVKYLQIALLPDAPVTMYLYRPGMFAGDSPAGPLILAAAGVLLLGALWLAWRRSSWLFWYAWFFVWIAPSFNVGGYVSYLMAEKGLYLAVLGPCVLLTALALQNDRRRPVAVALLLVLVAGHASATIHRGGFWSDTVTYIEQLTAFEPDYEVAHYQLAIEYAKRGRHADALARFAEVARIRPELQPKVTGHQAEIHERWGQQFAEAGDLANALIHLEQARQLAPRRSSVHNSLGIVHYLRGDHATARHHWQQALTLDPRNREARENLRRLR
ncbi:MAG: tetratricopeptide repeat protein, partial [Desulfuromonadales bacterium]|nr:tetratricopeptide repeat protein [Desulfuromonadales bacterium]